MALTLGARLRKLARKAGYHAVPKIMRSLGYFNSGVNGASDGSENFYASFKSLEKLHPLLEKAIPQELISVVQMGFALVVATGTFLGFWKLSHEEVGETTEELIDWYYDTTKLPVKVSINDVDVSRSQLGYFEFLGIYRDVMQHYRKFAQQAQNAHESDLGLRGENKTQYIAARFYEQLAMDRKLFLLAKAEIFEYDRVSVLLDQIKNRQQNPSSADALQELKRLKRVLSDFGDQAKKVEELKNIEQKLLIKESLAKNVIASRLAKESFAQYRALIILRSELKAASDKIFDQETKHAKQLQAEIAQLSEQLRRHVVSRKNLIDGNALPGTVKQITEVLDERKRNTLNALYNFYVSSDVDAAKFSFENIKAKITAQSLWNVEAQNNKAATQLQQWLLRFERDNHKKVAQQNNAQHFLRGMHAAQARISFAIVCANERVLKKEVLSAHDDKLLFKRHEKQLIPILKKKTQGNTQEFFLQKLREIRNRRVSAYANHLNGLFTNKAFLSGEAEVAPLPVEAEPLTADEIQSLGFNTEMDQELIEKVSKAFGKSVKRVATKRYQVTKAFLQLIRKQLTADQKELNQMQDKGVISKEFAAQLSQERLAAYIEAIENEKRAEKRARLIAEQFALSAQYTYLAHQQKQRHKFARKQMKMLRPNVLVGGVSAAAQLMGVLVVLTDTAMAFFNGMTFVTAILPIVIFFLHFTPALPFVYLSGAIFAFGALMAGLFLTRPNIVRTAQKMTEGLQRFFKEFSLQEFFTWPKVRKNLRSLFLGIIALVASAGAGFFVYGALLTLFPPAAGILLPQMLATVAGFFAFIEIGGFRAPKLIEEAKFMWKLINGEEKTPWHDLSGWQKTKAVCAGVLIFLVAVGSFAAAFAGLTGIMAGPVGIMLGAFVGLAAFFCMAGFVGRSLFKVFVDHKEPVPVVRDGVELENTVDIAAETEALSAEQSQSIEGLLSVSAGSTFLTDTLIPATDLLMAPALPSTNSQLTGSRQVPANGSNM